MLTYKSASAIEWLQEVFNLDLTLVSRLGCVSRPIQCFGGDGNFANDVRSGHSQPRTHRGHDAKFPGMAITYALMQKLEELAESQPERVKIIKKANVKKINKEGNRITGVDYEFEGKTYTEYGPVILATGGYAADFTETSFIKKYRPDTYHLSTTNGSHATGDGQKMAIAIGGNGIDLDKIQIHPTGLVDPKDPKAKTKFLAAEALRGEGGILLNAAGDRFCDELGHRDYVSGEMFKNKFPIRLVLNSKASKVLDFHTRHYSGRGLMKKVTGEQLAKEIGCTPEKLQCVFQDYNDIAAGKKKDPYGKRFFPSTPFHINDEFHVALMEPVLHFTMGGIEINDRSEVLNSEGKPFQALYACGEVAGGVHGANRLGGSSLLGCVVYGRVAGDSASQYQFQSVLSGATSTAHQRLGQISLHIDPSNPGRITVDWTGSAASGAKQEQPAGQTAAHAVISSDGKSPGTVVKPKDPKEFTIPKKEFTMEEVTKHNKKEDCWVVVKGVVMDLTSKLQCLF